MKALTIRSVPKRLADALEREKRRRGASLNQTVLELLNAGVGLEAGSSRRNGLARFAGTWSPTELSEFEAAIASTEQIDEDLWR